MSLRRGVHGGTRTTRAVELGDGVLDAVRDAGVDLYGLYRWHLQRTLGMIDALKARYGIAAVEAIQRKQLADRFEQGVRIAEELGGNSLDDYIAFSIRNGSEVVSRTDTEVALKNTGCLAGRIAHEIGREEDVGMLNCATDPTCVRGFNVRLGCEVVTTLMDGEDHCIHRVFIANCGEER